MRTRSRWPQILLLVALPLAAGCSEEIESDAATGQAEPAAIRLASLDGAPTTPDGYTTYLYSERDVDVYSRPGGGDFFEQGVIVEKIHMEVGDRVEAGQLLATLEDDEARLELDAARARADEARAQYERMETLKEKQVITPAQYDSALYAMRTAEAARRRAELDFSRTRVRAPFAGVVARRYIRVGELVREGTPLFRVTAMSPLRARVLVPESEAATFRIGAPARVRDARGREATARVVIMGPTVDPASGTREVVVELAEPDGFRPGASVRIEPLQRDTTED